MKRACRSRKRTQGIDPKAKKGTGPTRANECGEVAVERSSRKGELDDARRQWRSEKKNYHKCAECMTPTSGRNDVEGDRDELEETRTSFSSVASRERKKPTVRGEGGGSGGEYW